MTDIDTAKGKEPAEGAGTEGEDAFTAEWDALRDKEDGQGSDPPEPAEAPERTGEGDVDGQGDDPPPPAAAPDAPAAETETPDDLWAGADPKLREAFEAQLARADKAENVIRSNNGRLSQATHQLRDLEAELEQYRSGSGSKKPDAEEAGKTRAERLEKLREDYPELADSVIAELDDLRQTVRKLESAHQVQTEQRDATFVQEQERLVGEAHPKWLEDVRSQAFVEWAGKQPRYIQEGIQRNGQQIVDGVETADILDRFKRDTGQSAGPDPEAERLRAKRSEQLDGSRSTATRAPSAAPKGTGDSYDDEWARLEREDRRKAAGQR